MKHILVLAGVLFLMTSCKKDEPLDVVYPKAYLPAYPGSIWYYSNGDVSMVHTQYVAHSYDIGINSTENTETKLVPYIDHEYLYGYEITQNSNAFPLKKLLSENVADKQWMVDSLGSDYVFRKTISKLDSLVFTLKTVNNLTDTLNDSSGSSSDTLFRDILVVVEFLGDLDATKWNKKEYYAKNVGLIQVEINDPYDTLAPVILKKLNYYKINK